MRETDVQDVPERSRYEITVDGTLAGFAEYRDMDGVRVFTHTEVFEEFEGRGLGSRLARAALDDVRATGRQLVPICPFIDHYLGEHGEYADLIDTDLETRLRTRSRR